VVWSDSWPVTGADSANIATQIDAKLQEVEDD
jgi:hypothetical protein